MTWRELYQQIQDIPENQLDNTACVFDKQSGDLCIIDFLDVAGNDFDLLDEGSHMIVFNAEEDT